MPSNAPIVTKDVVKILGWPTDVVSIDFAEARPPPHTYLLFVPGNPGLVGWYIPALVSILQQLGSGFAVRGVSYAGHGITEETVHVEKYEQQQEGSSKQQQEGSSKRNVQIPWTVNGQIDHKIAWIASIMEQLQQQQQHNTRLIFLSHSIGAHMVQRILVLRKDWRDRTTAILHWMPFIRMDAPSGSQFVLDTAAHHPDVVIGIGQRLLQATSRERMESLMKDMVPDKEGCELAVNLVQHPTFVRNFFELGTEEIRDLPQLPDISALRLLSSSSIPTFILYCSNDQWFPEQHAHDYLVQVGGLASVELEFCPDTKHDFIVHPEMVPNAVDFCVRAIRRVTASKL